MLPAWLAHDQLAIILTGVVPAVGVQGWRVLAWAWLGLFAVWLPLCRVTRARALRYGWFELLACVHLYALFSPLMAFALYFGFYHAPVHIWRVWRASSKAASVVSPRISVRTTVAAVGLTMLLAWMLAAALWWFLAAGVVATPDWAAALRWLIVAFAALTAPHLVLISLCAAFLTQSDITP